MGAVQLPCAHALNFIVQNLNFRSHVLKNFLSFFSSPKQLGTGGIEIQQSGVLESGTYIVEVTIEEPGRPFTRANHTANVTIAGSNPFCFEYESSSTNF